MTRLRSITALLILIPIGLAFSVPAITVRSGHDGAVTVVDYDADRRIMYTAGMDGKLLVWDTESGRLLQSIRADQLPIRRMARYPDGRRIALLSSDGQRNSITVWDWQSGERVFLHSPDDEVLSLAVSAGESYLMYSTPAFQSVRVLDAETGRPLPFLRQDTGIVSWMVVATSEERVMTYTPASGMLTYRAIVTGRTVAEFQAPQNLELPTLLSSRRYAAARSADGALVVIDLLSGEIVSEAVAGEINQLYLDPANGDLVVDSTLYGGRRTVRRYEFDGASLRQRYATRRELPEELTALELVERGFFGGTAAGTIVSWPPYAATPRQFAGPVIERITDISTAGNGLHMLTASRLISIASDFFGLRSDEVEETEFVRESVVRLDVGPRTTFIPVDDRDVLMWTPEHPEARIHDYRIGSRTYQPVDLELPSGLIAVDAYNNELLTLSRSGSVELRNRRTGETLLDYRGRGLQTAIRTSRGVFIGKAAQGVLDSAVIRVNVQTGETVPLDTESDLVFFLDFDARRGRLFAIGIRDGADGITTVVEVFEGVNLDRRRSILEVPGEYLDAVLTHDPVTGTAYTTLDDRGGVLRWDGRRTTELLRNQAHIPQRLYLLGDFLYSLNRDGTVSVVDRFRGEPVVDFYVIDGGWIAVRPDGRFFASSDRLATDRYLSLNVDGISLDDRRLAIGDRGRYSPGDTVPRRSENGPIHRFDSAEDPETEAETEGFDPRSGDPAPSS